MSLWFAHRFCMEGLGQVRPILVGGLLGLGANALLDWLLIFGHCGLPAFGAVGCGLATAGSSALMAAVLARSRRGWFRRGASAAQGQVGVREGAREILLLGLPIGAVLLAEAGLFVVAALLMARFGEVTVAAYQVAINVAALAFMIPVGIAQATTVRVGLAAGAGEHAAARARGLAGMGLGVLNAASNAAIMTILARFIVGIYTQDTEIGPLAVHFLWLAAAFQFFDGLQATANGALRGIKDARMPLAVTLVAYWLIGLPVAWTLAFRTGLRADGLWWGLSAGLGAAAFGLSLRFARRTRFRPRRSEHMA